VKTLESAPIAAARVDAPLYIRPGYRRLKRVVDIAIAVVILLPAGLLLMAVVAICVAIDSRGPILIRQQRIGERGRPFTMLKFRSMYRDTDDTIHRQAIERYMAGEHLSDGPATSAPYKLARDRRVTRVGAFIRKTSLDELPQVFNVLVGQMSFVGPRPPLPYEVERYSAHDLRRLDGTPGITGTWQVYGRSRVPFDEMVAMDIAYLRRQSILYDLKLIAATVPAALGGHGAE
jgi:lipopolysaccharide/colanic/teichoic acid biosynthesis glycosyltransferase